jgi:hypothetical protein
MTASFSCPARATRQAAALVVFLVALGGADPAPGERTGIDEPDEELTNEQRADEARRALRTLQELPRAEQKAAVDALAKLRQLGIDALTDRDKGLLLAAGFSGVLRREAARSARQDRRFDELRRLFGVSDHLRRQREAFGLLDDRARDELLRSVRARPAAERTGTGALDKVLAEAGRTAVRAPTLKPLTEEVEEEMEGMVLDEGEIGLIRSAARIIERGGFGNLGPQWRAALGRLRDGAILRREAVRFARKDAERRRLAERLKLDPDDPTTWLELGLLDLADVFLLRQSLDKLDRGQPLDSEEAAILRRFGVTRRPK